MARFNNKHTFEVSVAAASAAAAAARYFPVDQPFLFTDYSWMYATTEANADNTLDFVADYTVDGTNFISLQTNANAVGLLNTSAPLVTNINAGNAASGGGAAVVAAPTVVRVPAGAVIRVILTTAGTGTIPAIQFNVVGQFV